MKYVLIAFFIFPQLLFAQNYSNNIERTYVTPTRIVWQTDIKNSQVLLQPGIRQADLRGKNYCELGRSNGKNDAIILDFGKEIQGGIQLVTAGFPGKSPIKVRLRFGESVSETMSDVGVDGSTNDHSMRDFEVQLPWMGKIDIGSTGFRFVRIDLLDSERTLYLKEISAISELRNIPYLGSFECDDEDLNQIWQIGAFSVHLNMQEYLWDGIKRDRLVWVGDMHPEVVTISAVFGYNDVVPKSLDYIRDITPSSEWMNGISSYSMWWILIHRDWYLAHGNLDYLQKQKKYIKELLNKLCSKINANGEERLDGNRFLDWPTSNDKKTIKLGYQSLLVLTLQAGEQLSDWLGDTETAQLCNRKVDLLKKAKLPKVKSKQAAALMALASMMDIERAKTILSKGNAEKFSTFYGYYMLEALAKADDYQVAIDIIKEYWGGMIELGATSFWEDFDIRWKNNAGRIDEMPMAGKNDVHRMYGDYCYKGYRHSYCHGWASGPTAWLSTHLLGIKVIEPGCKKVIIEPHLANLKWAKGSFPTPHGVIEVEHTKNAEGKIQTSVKSPVGVEVEVKKSI